MKQILPVVARVIIAAVTAYVFAILGTIWVWGWLIRRWEATNSPDAGNTRYLFD